MLRHKNEFIRAATEKVDQSQIKRKFATFAGDKIREQQDGKLNALFSKDAKRLLKIEYYDTVLNLERKIDHFEKLFEKMRLRVIHKPFIILDMLKLMPEDQATVSVLSSLYNKLRRMKLRAGLDQVILWVEHKKGLVQMFGQMAKAMLRDKRRKFMEKERERVRQEVRVKRQGQVVSQTLRYFGTMINNIVREKKKDTLGILIMRIKQREKQEKIKKDHNLRIQGNHGFVMQKKSKAHLNEQELAQTGHINQKNNSRYDNKDSEVRKKGPTEKARNEQARDRSPDKTRKNRPMRPKEVSLSFGRNAGMNMLLKTGTQDSENDIRLASNRPSKDTRHSRENTGTGDHQWSAKNVFSRKTIGDKKGDLLGKITREIMDINEKMQREERDQTQELTLAQRIELLNRLTTLMELLKRYYETQRRKGQQEDPAQKKNFEHVLILVKKLMETLLKKMSDDLMSSPKRNSHKKIAQGGIPDTVEDEKALAEDDHRSLARIDQMTRQLTKDLENLIPPTYEFETLGNTQHGSVYDARDKEFQSISAINNLLQEVVQNLNNIQDNMQSNTLIGEGHPEGLSGVKNSAPMLHSDLRTEGSKYTDFIEQSDNRGGLFTKNFMRRRNNSKLTNESDFRNPSLKNKYDPAYQEGLEDAAGTRVEMLNFLGVLNFKIQKYNRKLIEKSFDWLFQKAVTEELIDKLRKLGQEMKKERMLAFLAKLGVESNRRMHLRNHSIFRLSKAMLTKKKWGLALLRQGTVSVQMDPNHANFGNVQNYFGEYEARVDSKTEHISRTTGTSLLPASTSISVPTGKTCTCQSI